MASLYNFKNMADIATAQVNSSLQRALDDSLTQINPYVYSNRGSMAYVAPHMPARITKSLPSDSLGTWAVPKNGVWTGLSMSATFSVTTPNVTVGTLADRAGLARFLPFASVEYIELRTASTLLCRLTSTALVQRAYFDEADPAYRDYLAGKTTAYADYTQPNDAANEEYKNELTQNAANAFATNVTIPFPCFDREGLHYNTKITEPLYVYVKRRPWTYIRRQADTLAAHNDQAGTTTGAIDYQLSFKFETLAESLQSGVNTHLQSKGDRGVARLMLNYNVQTEVVEKNTAETGAQVINLLRDYPTTRLIVEMTAPVADAGGLGVRHRLGGVDSKAAGIDKIELLSSGVPIFDWTDAELKANMFRRGSSGYLLGKAYYVLDFGKSSKKTLAQTGFLSLDNISAPQLRITYSDGTANYTGDSGALSYWANLTGICNGRNKAVIRITYEYYIEESIQPRDGVVRVVVLK